MLSRPSSRVDLLLWNGNTPRAVVEIKRSAGIGAFAPTRTASVSLFARPTGPTKAVFGTVSRRRLRG